MKNDAQNCDGLSPTEFEVKLKPSAKRSIKQLPSNIQEKVFAKIRTLSSNPYPQGYRKKQGGENLHGLPIGAYRVIYSIEAKSQIVLILWAGHHQVDFHRPKFWKKLR